MHQKYISGVSFLFTWNTLPNAPCPTTLSSSKLSTPIFWVTLTWQDSGSFELLDEKRNNLLLDATWDPTSTLSSFSNIFPSPPCSLLFKASLLRCPSRLSSRDGPTKEWDCLLMVWGSFRERIPWKFYIESIAGPNIFENSISSYPNCPLDWESNGSLKMKDLLLSNVRTPDNPAETIAMDTPQEAL